jgi:hypothetical protein
VAAPCLSYKDGSTPHIANIICVEIDRGEKMGQQIRFWLIYWLRWMNSTKTGRFTKFIPYQISLNNQTGSNRFLSEKSVFVKTEKAISNQG